MEALQSGHGRTLSGRLGGEFFRQANDLRGVAAELLRRAGIPQRAVTTCAPEYSTRDRSAVLQVLNGESVWRLNSEAANRLVETFRKKVNKAKHLLPTDSGTAGLHVVLAWLIRSRGPRVLLPAWTWYSVPATVLNSGGRPVFVDVDPTTLQVAPFTDRLNVDCALASHLFGIPALNRNHLDWLKLHNIPLIEDCAQTIQGSVDEGAAVGMLGEAAIYSFNGSKAIPAGEGGIIATNNDKLGEHFLNFTMSVASPPDAAIRRFNDASEGWNYRLASLSASLAESLIHSLPERIETARRAYETLLRVTASRTWLMVVSPRVSCDLAPLGCPVRLLATVKGRTLAESRALFYYALRLSGLPVSVWVADPIPLTRRLQHYYKANPKDVPHAKSYAGASIIADGHVVFATNRAAIANYSESGYLTAVLDAYEGLLNT